MYAGTALSLAAGSAATALTSPVGAAAASQPVNRAVAVVIDPVDTFLASTPTDAQLASATDAQLIGIAVRCNPIAGLTYCVHLGWNEDGSLPTTTAQKAVAAPQPAAVTSGVCNDCPTGRPTSTATTSPTTSPTASPSPTTAPTSAPPLIDPPLGDPMGTDPGIDPGDDPTSDLPDNPADQPADTAADPADVFTDTDEGVGDTPLVAGLRAWAALPAAERRTQETEEINEAKADAGKAVFMNAVLNDQPLPANFGQTYPDLATWDTRAATTHAVLNSPPRPEPDYNRYWVMSEAKTLKKQEKGWYCGPASIQGIAAFSPAGAVKKTQKQWARILGTTKKNGSDITVIAKAINKYTTWDSRAGAYGVHSISSWNTNKWRALFVSQLGVAHAPVLLHPKLNSSVSTYYPGTTSGHFDVGRGYDFDGGDDKIYIYEPAGGAAQHNVYKSVYAVEDPAHVRLSNLNNALKNVSY